MGDSIFPLDPRHAFFTVDRDKDWKKMTSESFIFSTTVCYHFI